MSLRFWNMASLISIFLNAALDFVLVSAYRRANAICSSANLDFLMAKSLLLTIVILPDLSTFNWPRLRGEDHYVNRNLF